MINHPVYLSDFYTYWGLAAVKSVSNCLCFLLEDKSSITEQVQQKYRNVLKMLIYIYVETILFVEQANVTSAKNRGLTKGRQTSKSDHTDAFNLDKNSILVSLNNILQLEVALFWDPPVVEEHFINLIAEVCYKFLENPQIKADKVVREAVFSLMGKSSWRSFRTVKQPGFSGCLMKSYNHSTTFAIRMTQMIKDQEHLIQCLTEGTKFLVETHNCKGLIHALIQEVTEWQTDDTFQDSQVLPPCEVLHCCQHDLIRRAPSFAASLYPAWPCLCLIIWSRNSNI